MSVTIYPNDVKRSLESLRNEINRETDELSATIAGVGTEVAIAHQLDFIPTSFYQVVTQNTTGQGVLYPGSTAWDSTYIYVNATATGIYHLRVRR